MSSLLATKVIASSVSDVKIRSVGAEMIQLQAKALFRSLQHYLAAPPSARRVARVASNPEVAFCGPSGGSSGSCYTPPAGDQDLCVSTSTVWGLLLSFDGRNILEDTKSFRSPLEFSIMARIFLSHSSIDNFPAVAIAGYLKEEGWEDIFLDLDPIHGIHPGERWERSLYTHAADCEAVIFLISRNWLDSQWCKREFDLARKLNKRCFVVLIEFIAIDDLPFYLKETHQIVSLATGADHKVFKPKLPISHEEGYVTFSAEGLTRLKTGLQNGGLDPRFFAWPPASEPERAPYRGLEALGSIDAGIFFGRDGPTIEALDLLRGLREAQPPRLFVILGASGAGKSSFLRAGLLPRLSRDNRNFLVLPVVRPERAAISGPAGLIESIAEAMIQKGLTITRVDIRRAVAEGAGSLKLILKTLLEPSGEEKPPTIVLTIDQAEELFRAEARQESETVLNLIRELTAADEPGVVVIMVIRSDSYDALERAKTLEGIKQHTFALLPLPRGAYQTIIEGPLRRLRLAGRKFEIDPDLTELLLEDIEKGGGTDALPLLSFTLQLLYRDHEAAKHVSREDYFRFGGLKGSISAALERAFVSADSDPRIPRDHQARLTLLRRGFIPWLAGVDPQTKSFRRRVARVAQIPAEALPLLDLLVEQRLLTRDVDKETCEATIEPAHEALLRQWGGLKGWLEEDFGRLAILESVRRAATDWDANARDAGWLAHGGVRLSEADQLDLRADLAALLGQTDRAYLAACRQKEKAAREAEEERRCQEKRVKQFKRVASFVFAGSLLSYAIAAWAVHDRQLAKRRIEAATDTANKLVTDIAGNIANIAGVPVSTVINIIDVSKQLQQDLIESGYKTVEFQRSRASAQEKLVPFCLMMGEISCALTAAEKAIDLRTSLLNADPFNPMLSIELARASSRMGDVKSALGGFTEALTFYSKALSIQANVLQNERSNYALLRELALTRQNVGDMLIAQGKVQAAYDSYEKSFAELQHIVSLEPDLPEDNCNLAKGYQKLGMVLFKVGDRASAQQLFAKAVQIMEILVKTKDMNTDFQEGLAMSYVAMGDAQLKMGKLDQALASFHRSFNVMKALVSLDYGRVGWARELAQIESKLGDVYFENNQIDLADASYSEGIARLEHLLNTNQNNAVLQRSLAEGLSRRGDARLFRGDFAGALQNYLQSVQKYEAFPPSEQHNIRWKINMARINDFIGTILHGQNDYTQAIAAFRKAVVGVQLSEKQNDDWEYSLQIVDTYKKLAWIDKVNGTKHIKAAEAILDRLSAGVSEEDIDARRSIDFEKTQVGNSSVDAYALIGRHANDW